MLIAFPFRHVSSFQTINKNIKLPRSLVTSGLSLSIFLPIVRTRGFTLHTVRQIQMYGNFFYRVTVRVLLQAKTRKYISAWNQ